jgi:hypothetical protein
MTPNGIAPSGTSYVGSAGFAYMFWHLARHVAHGSLTIPRHLVVLRPRHSQRSSQQDAPRKSSPVTAEELYRLSLTICDTSIQATSLYPGRCTFLEGYSGPLALRCAILTALNRHEVCSTSDVMIVLSDNNIFHKCLKCFFTLEAKCATLTSLMRDRCPLSSANSEPDQICIDRVKVGKITRVLNCFTSALLIRPIFRLFIGSYEVLRDVDNSADTIALGTIV